MSDSSPQYRQQGSIQVAEDLFTSDEDSIVIDDDLLVEMMEAAEDQGSTQRVNTRDVLKTN